MNALVRSASLINYASVAREAGLEPHAMLAEVGLPIEALNDTELWVPARSVRDLMALSARRSGWDDFGLRLAETRQFWVVGPVALAVREQASLRLALAVLVRHMDLHNEALHLWVEEDPLGASLHLSASGGLDVRQSMELTAAMLHRFLQVALPDGWQPQAVCFTHSAPSDARTARRMFGSRLHYDAEFNGIVFKLSDLDLPMGTYSKLDQVTRQYLNWLIDNSGRSTARQVRQLILALLPTGQCHLSRIAEHLNVEERTVHRRLQRENVSYTALLNETRHELVQRYLESGRRKQSELALLLGFTGATVFSRWFRQQFGCTTRTWRHSTGMHGAQAIPI